MSGLGVASSERDRLSVRRPNLTLADDAFDKEEREDCYLSWNGRGLSIAIVSTVSHVQLAVERFASAQGAVGSRVAQLTNDGMKTESTMNNPKTLQKRAALLRLFPNASRYIHPAIPY